MGVQRSLDASGQHRVGREITAHQLQLPSSEVSASPGHTLSHMALHPWVAGRTSWVFKVLQLHTENQVILCHWSSQRPQAQNSATCLQHLVTDLWEAP